MIESNNKLKWYVFRHDFNRKVIYPFNIFDHYSFYQDCCKHYKKYLKDIPCVIYGVQNSIFCKRNVVHQYDWLLISEFKYFKDLYLLIFIPDLLIFLL